MADGAGINQQAGNQSEPIAQFDAALNTANSTLVLAQGFDAYMGHPVGNLVKERMRKTFMQAYLGQWYPIVYNEKKSTLWIPVLMANNFTEYMQRANGTFQLTGENVASAPWAHLLHALGITPQNRHILDWRRVPLSATTSECDYKPTLEVDGEVFCHIVKLFGGQHTYPPNDKKLQGNDTGGSCSTMIGTFAWDITSDEPKLSLNSRTELRNLSHLCCPLFVSFDFPREKYQHYQNAMLVGVSDFTLVLPYADRPLDYRVEAFDSVRKTITDTGSLLLTQKWLWNANRIRHRVATNKDSDFSFMNDVIDQIKHNAGSDAAKKMAKNEGALERLNELRTSYVTSLFLKNSLVYEPVSLAPDESLRFDQFYQATADAMRQVLERYGKAEEGTWKRSLYKGGQGTVTIVTDDAVKYKVEKAGVLIFDSSMQLWNMGNIPLTGNLT